MAQMTKHQFYYTPVKSGKRGRPPSTHTLRLLNGDWQSVLNEEIELEMRSIDANPDLSCGAVRMTDQLQLKGYKVNHKKVAAMMKRLGISGKYKRRSAKRDKKYVQYRVLNPTQPLTHLQMDIKSHWLIGERCQAYTLTTIDTFTREVLGHYTGLSIKALHVKALWEKIIEEHLEPAGRAWSEVALVVISDNGPQFIAEVLKEFFENNGIDQLFTHPYTPQENAYIESFHASMSASVEREHFSLEELKSRLNVFYNNYNQHRTHTSTKGLPPILFRQAWENDLVITCFDPKKPVVLKLRHPLYEIPGILNRKEHLARKNCAQRGHLEAKSGETKSSALNEEVPVNTSPSVASCQANEVREFELN
jgi:putative transposase